MALGDDSDFRMVGFQHVLRFPPQDRIGGTGSPMRFQPTAPFGNTNLQFDTPPLVDLPSTTITFPGQNFPGDLNVILNMGQGGGTGGGTPTLITVEDLNTPQTYPDIDTIEFVGAGVTVSAGGSANVVNVDIPGGAGGSTIVYGKITGGTKTAGKAIWTYTVQLYSGGSASGSPVTAYNLFEKENTTTTAYGYSVTGADGDQITGTSYFVRRVPSTWVSLEQTSDVTGSSQYWFAAPNRIDGAC